MDLRKSEADYRKTVQLLFLIAAGIVLFPFVIVDGVSPGMGYFLAEKYMAVPCLLFFGSALSQRLSPSAKRSLQLSVIAVLFFVAVQMQHQLTHMGTRNFGIFAVVYLLAFPYAAVTEDGGENVGLKWIGRIYVAFSLLLMTFAGMLLLDVVPEALAPFVYWDGARAVLFWHPNGSGCILMLGIGFSLYFLTLSEKKWEKRILAILTVLQFCSIILTNSRTTIFLTCALIGGTVFFKLWKGGWKQFLAVAAAALAVVVVMAVVYSALFDLHTEAQINKLMEQAEQAEQTEQETGKVESTTQTLRVDTQTGEITLSGTGNSGQGELSQDIKHLNGRFSIWKAAFQALQENPSVRIWGTEYVSAEISSRNTFAVVNAHNSWIQTWMQLGISGFLVAMVYTVIAAWNIWTLLWRQNVDISKKVVAMTVVCILAASLLEAYLFVGEMPSSFVNFIFFLCTGYLIQWNAMASAKA